MRRGGLQHSRAVGFNYKVLICFMHISLYDYLNF